MIEVTINYKRKLYKGGKEVFIYKDIVVKGHSSDGTINSLKCCAGVTAITCGIIHALDLTECKVEINKGYFHYHAFEEHSLELDYLMNGVVYQLANVSTIYPEFFKEFDFKEEK